MEKKGNAEGVATQHQLSSRSANSYQSIVFLLRDEEQQPSFHAQAQGMVAPHQCRLVAAEVNRVEMSINIQKIGKVRTQSTRATERTLFADTLIRLHHIPHSCTLSIVQRSGAHPIRPMPWRPVNSCLHAPKRSLDLQSLPVEHSHTILCGLGDILWMSTT